MRSIRRSLLVYILLLLVLALGGVGLFVNRFANGVIKDREKAERDRIDNAYRFRQLEAEQKFDDDLLAETKALVRELNPKLQFLFGFRPGPGRGGPQLITPGQMPGTLTRSPDHPSIRASEEEADEYRLRLTTLLLQPGLVANWPSVVATDAMMDPPSIAPRGLGPGGGPGLGGPRTGTEPLTVISPLWTAYDAPRAVPRIQEALRKLFEEDEHPGYYQFDLIVTFPGHPGRATAIIRSPRLSQDMPLPASLDLDPPDRNPDTDYIHDNKLLLSNQEAMHRVIKVMRPAMVWMTPPTQVVPGRPLAPRPRSDLRIQIVVQHARPQSELDARLIGEVQKGKDELAQVQDDTRKDLSQLRLGLAFIGGGSFLALMLGGWFIVARGLSPIRKLSDAVSLVSEKDFKLPHDGTDLAVELAPIHAGLTQTLTLLQRAFSREKQAVADISHELRTPIAALQATIDVSLRKQRTPEQYRSTLEECRLISRQLGQLVERIMTLASLDAGNDRTLISRTDASELASACAAVIRPLAVANGMTLNTHIDDEIELDTDPSKLREVLMNLLHNAVEYNKPGGAIELTAQRDNGSVVFGVKDTGIGMPAEVKDKIFERFFRADASRHATGVHAGLGLAIVKEYVARLNGVIEVESEPGTGSTFRITLAAPSQSDTPIVTRSADKPAAVGT